MAICKESASPYNDPLVLSNNTNRVERELNNIGGIYWDGITKAEFETYQAFGIKEIKLQCTL